MKDVVEVGVIGIALLPLVAAAAGTVSAHGAHAGTMTIGVVKETPGDGAAALKGSAVFRPLGGVVHLPSGSAVPPLTEGGTHLPTGGGMTELVHQRILKPWTTEKIVLLGLELPLTRNE